MQTSQALPNAVFFFRRFLRNPRQVGALLPSTRRLGEEMVRDLELGDGDLVVEYGPGTGSLTVAIAERLRSLAGVQYLGIEREPGFCAILRKRFPELRFVNGSVEDVKALLAEHGLQRPRAILSGLPLILLPNMADIVAEAAEVLQPGGEFRTFSYLQSRLTPMAGELRRLLHRHFVEASSSPLVWGNLPPAWVLRGRSGPVQGPSA